MNNSRKPIIVIRLMENLSSERARKMSEGLSVTIGRDYYVIILQGRQQEDIQLLSEEQIGDADTQLLEDIKQFIAEQKKDTHE